MGRKLYAEKNYPENHKWNKLNYRNGDLNTSIIKTELGRTILVQWDETSPRPYSKVKQQPILEFKLILQYPKEIVEKLRREIKLKGNIVYFRKFVFPSTIEKSLFQITLFELIFKNQT